MFEHLMAERMNSLAGESAFQVLAAAKNLEAQGKTVIHFEIGEPDFPTAPNIVAAGKKALDAGMTTYCNAQGLPVLREAIADYSKRYKNLDYTAEEVVVTQGGKPVIFYTLSVLVNPGDEVICPNPGFPTYESVIRYLDGIPVPIPMLEKNNFRLDVQVLKEKITPRTRLLILNSPANPTGSYLTENDLAEIAEAIQGRDIFVLSDEIYSRICYEGEAKSIAAFPGMKDKTIVLDGFSKTYAMTGWRLGYGLMNPALAEKVTRLQINASSCTPPFIQMAGLEALAGPQDSVAAMVSEYKKRRDVIVSGLNDIPGISCQKPDGAFYAFPNIQGTGRQSGELAHYLLHEAGVAVLDGAAFGQFGAGYLRLSYATSLDLINAGLTRIEAAVKKLIR